MYRNIFRLSQKFVRNSTRNIGEYKSASLTAPWQHDDDSKEIDAGMRIEAELFENSTLQHKPVLAKGLIRERLHPSNNYKQPPRDLQQPKVIDDPDLGLQFVRLGWNDPMLSTLLTTVRSQKRRYKDRQIIVEGRRLIQEALDCDLRLNTLIFSQVDQLRQVKDEVAVAQNKLLAKIFKVPQHVLKTWSTLTTPPGLLAVFERPSQEHMIENIGSKANVLPITVVCDNVREPNNLGSIIRTCAAVPCEQVIAIRGCCDPWESKALRGGCGGHFRIPIRDKVDWEDLSYIIASLAADDCSVFVAENNIEKVKINATTVDYAALDRISAHNVVIIGGETQGVSKEAYRFLETAGNRGKCLHIPLAEGIDSLNVSSALTLILYELRRCWLKQEQNKSL